MKNIDNVVKFNAKTIKGLFSDSTPFLIPPLQRTYQWNKEIEALWDDLKDYRDLHHMDDDYQYEVGQRYVDIAPYLIGSTYVSQGILYGEQNEQVFEVLDGQQRLTTLLIGLLVLREMYQTIDSEPALKEPLATINSQKKKLKQHSPLSIFHQVSEVISHDITGPKLRYARKSTNDFWTEVANAEGSKEIQLALDKKNPDNGTEINIANAFDIYREKVFTKNRFKAFEKFKFTWNKKDKKWRVDTLVRLCSQKNEDSSSAVENLGEFLTCLCGLASTILHCVGLVQFTCEHQQVSLFDIINNRGKTFEENDLTRIVLLSACPNTQIQSEVLEKWNDIAVTKDLLTWCWNAIYVNELTQMAKRQIHYQIDNAIKDQARSSADQAALWVDDFVENVVKSYRLKNSIGDVARFGSETFHRDALILHFDFDKFSMPVMIATEIFIKDLVVRQKVYQYLFNVLVRIKIGKENNNKNQTAEIPRLAVRVCQTIRTYADSPELLNKIQEMVQQNSIFQHVLEDDFFTQAFENFSLVGENGKEATNKFGYLLVALFEAANTGSSIQTLSPYGKTKKSEKLNNLEHIFPQTPNEANGWVFPAEDLTPEVTLNKLGNLLPLNAVMNSELLNLSLDQKVKVYSNSGLQSWNNLKSLLEKDCAPSCYSWTFEKINERSKLLAQAAKDLFSLTIKKK